MAIISITGKIGSGKDTAAEIIKELAPEYVWEIKKFAGKLKTIASILTNIPIEKFEDQEFKKTLLPKEWSYWTPEEEVKDMSVRELLQLLGTEAMRNSLHPNAWVNALWSDYTDTSNWIITDTRFFNELNSIIDRKGVAIRINHDSGNTVGIHHTSETALDGYHGFHHEVDNNGTLEDLREQLKHILMSEGII